MMRSARPIFDQFLRPASHFEFDTPDLDRASKINLEWKHNTFNSFRSSTRKN